MRSSRSISKTSPGFVTPQMVRSSHLGIRLVLVLSTSLAADGAFAQQAPEPMGGGLWTSPEAVDAAPTESAEHTTPQPTTNPIPAEQQLPPESGRWTLKPPPAPGLPIRAYGFIKAGVVYGFSGFESFSQPNQSAITAAGNPVVGQLVDNGRYTFQVAQSRVGAAINDGQEIRGLVELDFWDPTKPSPTVATLPRLRIAKVTWAPSSSFALELGQDWDLHAPVQAHTANFIGGLFEAGNTGFMRQQLKVLFKPTHFELGLAVGFPASNNGASQGVAGRDGLLELSGIPTFALRVAAVTDGLTAGVSAIATGLHFNKGQPVSRRALAGAGALYLIVNPVEWFDLRIESYVGRNAENIGLLSLGRGRGATLNPNGTVALPDADLDELGAFASLRVALGSWGAAYAMAGVASVLNREDLLPSYSRTAEGTVVLTSATTGPGIKRNIAARAGYELRPLTYLALFAEGFAYETLHRLQDADAMIQPRVRAYGIESGIILYF